MSGADKRLFRRFACDLAVELETRDGSVLGGQSRNLSRGGLCLETSDPVPAGADVTVRITLVFDEDRSSEPLDLPAQVVWCTPFGQHAHQVGTQFRQLSSERLTYLDMFLRYLEQQAASERDAGDADEDDEDDPFAA
jgi:Tfp pilus assembly protein PilZ